MEFANDRHRAAYERIHSITSQYQDFGEMTDAPGFVLPTESARVFILVLPWAQENNVIQIRAYLEGEFTQDVALSEYLLSLNSKVVLGAWGKDSGRVFYQYTAPVDDLEEDAFHLYMNAVVASVEGPGKQLAERWGLSGSACCTPGSPCETDSCGCGPDGCGPDDCGCDTPEPGDA